MQHGPAQGTLSTPGDHQRGEAAGEVGEYAEEFILSLPKYWLDGGMHNAMPRKSNSRKSKSEVISLALFVDISNASDLLTPQVECVQL